MNVQLSPGGEFGPNTADVLEISSCLRNPSEEVFEDSISIANTEARSKPSVKIDVIKIGHHSRKDVIEYKPESPTKIEASGKSIEIVERPLSPIESQDDYLKRR